MSKLRISALLLCISFLFGCAKQAAQPKAQEAGANEAELLILAAASLNDVLQDVADSYAPPKGSPKLIFSFDSSSALKTQIEEGVPADIFISASGQLMDELNEKAILYEVKPLLKNALTLIVPEAFKMELAEFKACADERVKTIALCEEGVPAGDYAREVFSSLGLWETVKAKAVFAPNVRAVLAWVEAGNADCGVVYATDARLAAVRVAASAPANSHKEIIYPAALLKRSEHSEACQAFFDYLFSAEAAGIFKEWGFTVYG